MSAPRGRIEDPHRGIWHPHRRTADPARWVERSPLRIDDPTLRMGNPTVRREGPTRWIAWREQKRTGPSPLLQPRGPAKRKRPATPATQFVVFQLRPGF